MPTSSDPLKLREYKRSEYFDTRSPGWKSLSYVNAWLTRASETRLTNENPNWMTQVATGTDASLDYQVRRFTVRRPPFLYGEGLTDNSAYGYEVRSRCTAIHSDNFLSSLTLPTDTALREIALSRIKRKIQSHYGNKNVMTPAAELRELRGLIRGLTGRSTKLIKDLTSIRETKRRNVLDHASDAWLTYNFGIKPMIKDVQDVGRSISSFLGRDDHSFRVTGTASKEWFSSLLTTGETGLYNAPIKTETYAKHTLSYRYVGGFDTSVESSNDYGIAAHLGLGPDELLATAWELVPYSWITDYFTTIGAYLDDTFVLPSGNLKYLTLNTRYTVESTSRTSFVPVPGTNTRVLSQVGIPGSVKMYDFSRLRLSTLPRIGLRFRSVDEIGSNAVNKLLNLTAVFYRRRS